MIDVVRNFYFEVLSKKEFTYIVTTRNVTVPYDY